MERKNLGQKIVIERFLSSLILTFQRAFYSSLFGAVIYSLFFNYFIGFKYFFIPIFYYIHKIILFILPYLYNVEDDFISNFFKKIFNYKRIYYKYSIYSEMQNLINKYFLISVFISIISSIAFFIIITRYFNKKGKILNEGRHYRGLKIVDKRQFNSDIKKEIKSGETGLEYTNKDLYVGKDKLRIPKGLGGNMWAFLGVSGTGKSQGMFDYLLLIRSYGEKAIIVDPAGEYCKRFCTENDIILSLYDVRSEPYSFWNEGLDPMTIATSLIEEINSTNPFWSKAGQALFAGLLAQNDSPKKMYEMLLENTDTLKEKFKAQADAAGVVLGEGEQAGGVISTAAVDLLWLKNMNHWADRQGKKDPFSIMKWAKNNNDKRWVFLTYADRHKSVAKHLVRLWSDLAVLGAFTRGESIKNVLIWLVCDELSTIGKLPSMSLLEDRGRKYGLGLMAGFQTPSQLEVMYGTALAKVMIQGLQNLVMFRSGEKEMLEFMSQNCGEAEYIQSNSSSSFGVRNTESMSEQIVRRRNVLPDEFRLLKNNNAYLKVSGHNPIAIKIKHKKLPIINEPDMSFVPKYENWDGKINGKYVIKNEEINLDINNTDSFVLDDLKNNDSNIINKDNSINITEDNIPIISASNEETDNNKNESIENISQDDNKLKNDNSIVITIKPFDINNINF